MATYDAVIVGAGPAGSIAAFALARAGRRIALLDRAAFPRPKICGNCVNPAAWAIWEKMGLTDAYSALPHREMRGFTIRSEGRLLYEDDFEPPHGGPRALSREVLDDWLRQEAQAAGAEFFPETAVTGLDPATGLVQTAHGQFQGRLVFGADGRNSVIARLSGLMPPPRRCQRIAWQASIPAPTDLDDRVHMHLFEEGYFGICRFDAEQAVISLVLDARQSMDPLALVRRSFPWLPEQEWLRMNPITRAPAPCGSGKIWLLGDAARVVEPFTGEGIVFALTTGLLAAEAALAGEDLGAYSRKHARLYRRRAWVNTLTRWALIEPGRTVRALRRVRQLPGVTSWFARRIHQT